MAELRSDSDLKQVIDTVPDIVAHDSDEEEEKDKGSLDSDTLWYDDNEQAEANLNVSSGDEDDETEDLGLVEDEDDGEIQGEVVLEKDETENHPLLQSLNKTTAEERKAQKAELWFEKIGDLDSEDDIEDAEIEKAVSMVNRKGGSILQKKSKTCSKKDGGDSQQPSATESGYTSGSDDEEADRTLESTIADAVDNTSDKYSDTDDSDDSSSD